MKLILTRKEIREKFGIPSDIKMEIAQEKIVGRRKGARKSNGYKVK